MKKSSKVLALISLMLVGLLICSLCTVAATPECRLTVILKDAEKKDIDEIEVNITKIADVSGNGYYPSADFENSDISISAIVNNPSAEKAKSLFEFIKENQILSLSCISKSGEAEFAGLSTGIWLVHCDKDEKYTFNPYIVFLPYLEGDKLHYELSSTPKIEVNTPNKKNIYVIKKWEDKNNAAKQRPSNITVELQHNATVIDRATLSESNGWVHTFSQLSNEGEYTVFEKEVKGYSVEYSGDSENGFIITNTYVGEKLPQTGQLWWPIIIISVVGILFVLLGIIELGAHKNGNKIK